MRAIQIIVGAIGRICLSLIFILAAVNMIMNWQEVEQHTMDRLHVWMTFTQEIDWMQNALTGFMSSATLLLAGAVTLQLLGGLLVFFGYQVRLGAVLLLLFLLGATPLCHDFWHLQGPDQQLQMTMFLKNLSMFGGLLLLLAYGKGKCKEEAPEEPPKMPNE